jgi:DNA gyrase inhibitor GyrI
MVMPEGSFETIPKTLVASIELRGSYENWGDGLMELTRWLDSKDGKPAGKAIGLFYDNPLETPPEKLRSKACIPIDHNVTAEGKFKIEELEGGMVAKTRHTGKPEEYTKTYGAFLEWLLKDGYTLRGPAREIFDRLSPDLRPGMGAMIQQPVTRTG